MTSHHATACTHARAHTLRHDMSSSCPHEPLTPLVYAPHFTVCGSDFVTRER